MSSSKYIDFLAKLKLSHAHPGGQALTDKLLKSLALKQDDHILDVGCGTGATAAIIKTVYGSEVTAADYHVKMIQAAAERAALMRNPFIVVRADAEDLPFESESFDAVLSESVSAFTQVTRSLPEYHRVLKKNKWWIGIEMTCSSNLAQRDIERIKAFYGVKEVLTEKEWLVYLSQAGFSQISVETGPDLIPEQPGVGYALPIENMNPEDLNIWWTHLAFMEQMKSELGYRIYKAKK